MQAEQTLHIKLTKILQKIGWLILQPVFKLLAGLETNLRADAKKLKSPLIIVANHSSFLDPIIVGLALPFGAKIYPIYYMTKDKIIGTPFLGNFLKMLGGFPAHKGEGLEKSLEIPKKILASGCSVVIFPQGKRFPDFQIEQGRPGAAALALASGVPILPVGISGISRLSWPKLFLFGYRVKIAIGQPFLLEDKLTPASQQDLNYATEIIMKEIEKLIFVVE